MNEFLKQLRSSGKDRQHPNQSQSRGQYDPNFQDRRTGNERRTHFQQRTKPETNEMLEVLDRISYFLEKLTDHQGRIAIAKERLAESQERNNIILEGIENHVNDFMATFTGGIGAAVPERMVCAEEEPASIIPETLDKKIAEKIAERQAGLFDREMIVQMVRKMRKQGSTYEQIAQFLDDEGIKTFSKKGKWHAQTIHRLCKG